MAHGMHVYYNPVLLSVTAPDGLGEGPPSELLAEQMPHVEGPARIANMASLLQRSPVTDALTWHMPTLATETDLVTFHTAGYLSELKARSDDGGWLTRTTYLPKGAWPVLCAQAGAALGAVSAVLSGQTKLAYALTRPPSHHAAPDKADGFCFLNGPALAAERARSQGCERVAIVDWDVHHGNGTQTGFYARGDILTISIHMDHGAWGINHRETGDVDEIGTGPGEGANLNLPLPFGSGDRAYLDVMERCVVPALERFQPDLILCASGVDASPFDPTGRNCVTMVGFHRMAMLLAEAAQRLSGGRVVVTQEGGYHPAHAPFCAYAVVSGLLGRPLELADPLSYYPDDKTRARRDVDEMIVRHPLL
ncbi:MAG: hypothetical protein AAFX39_12880 [Pseudomonadota bacterium]